MNCCRFAKKGFARGRGFGKGRCCIWLHCAQFQQGGRFYTCKHDGSSGSHKDGFAPRCCNIGPREDCPKRKSS